MNASETTSPPRTRVGLLLLLTAIGLIVGGVLIWLNVRSNDLGLTRDGGKALDRVGRNAPFITTSDPIIDKMVEMAALTKDDVAYDLGCGDGRIIIAASLKTGCRGVGFDIDPKRVAEARENVKQHGLENLVEIREQDIFTVDMREADAVLYYLLPWMGKKLIPQFQQMKPGSRIISHDFALGDIKDIEPEKTELVHSEETHDEHRVHRWIIPLKTKERVKP
jgi:SAM-dependent methyltransferase